ncbi:uncharacterized protein EI90DRAFT_3280525 [Cantharellus anzutake]|uniref:uncharacterized protein n=1 Tax=Cantharellus anzutake TaxID=1750568 RepID=UPI00190716A6|nr:uncharacterized protein EI90DRAFT_3280525 [Cantharellus anzutake]KAF8332598.1 hypothetical protein EI90DRAFT_3280525 [Cantharellus anzutake]
MQSSSPARHDVLWSAKGPRSPLTGASHNSQRVEHPPPSPRRSASRSTLEDRTQWGESFWITIIDPQTQAQFYACPATGEACWDPPAGHFVMPPNNDGEWWELEDETRGVPYYYHTKSGETQWTKPEGFIIPLGIIQTTTALGRRFSQNARKSATENQESSNGPNHQSAKARENGRDFTAHRHFEDRRRSATSSVLSSPRSATFASNSEKTDPQDGSTPDLLENTHNDDMKRQMRMSTSANFSSRTSSTPTKGPASGSRTNQIMDLNSQSLAGAVELLVATKGEGEISRSEWDKSLTLNGAVGSPPSPRGPGRGGGDKNVFIAPQPPRRRTKSNAAMDRKIQPKASNGKFITSPILDKDSTKRMNPAAMNDNKPVYVPPGGIKRMSTGDHRTLPRELAEDIQQFVVSEFAKTYFATHRTGLIFRRKVPVEQMMSWQKAPLSAPLLVLNRTLHKDAVRIFKIVQRIMGDRATGNQWDATTSPGTLSILEEERWLLSQGILHGELRDEIYCQVLKQLSGNPKHFHGWQFLCVLLVTFPPSKNLEAYVRSFMQERLTQKAGRIDIMAKYCIGRLEAPTCAEIETASDAAFNPSTFGESLESIFRLQHRIYPGAKVPIILPFLADGIIALGGLATEGTWRISGDADSVSELKVRIDKGHYNLEGINDCHVPASLLKLWLRELQDPLIPEEMYNECLECASDPEKTINIVKRLPTINKRVLLFIISLLQLFLQENIQAITKMNSVNLALVMSPNLLRCNSDLMMTVFTNTQHEHSFVHTLLLHLKPHRVDPDYIPKHGLAR